MGNMRGAQDLIVERSSLRRVNTEASVDTSQLVRRLVPVAPALHNWIYTQDAVGCLREVQSTARLFFASCIGREAGDERSPPEVVLVGNERAVELARKLLVQIHFKNQVEMLRFHEHKMRFQERLEDCKRWCEGMHREVFTVDQSLMGKVIGERGKNLRRV